MSLKDKISGWVALNKDGSVKGFSSPEAAKIYEQEKQKKDAVNKGWVAFNKDGSVKGFSSPEAAKMYRVREKLK